MRGEHSRILFRREERLSGVHPVMGAQVVDADLVESEAIAAELQRAAGQLAIRSGVPRDVGCLTFGTQVTTTGWTRPAITGLRPGFVVANGRVAEVRAAEGWTPGDDLLAAQVDLSGLAPALPANAVLYADVWDRVETPAMRPSLVDAAFLGAISSNRTVRMAQLKAAEWTDAALDDAVVRGAFADARGVPALPRTGDLRLTAVDFAQLPDAADPCDPCATEFADEAVDVGNHLFRIEVHESAFAGASLSAAGAAVVTTGDDIVLKWSRDNGGLEAAIGSATAEDLAADPRFASAVFEITTVAGDQRQGLRLSGDARRSTLVDLAGLEAAIAAGEAGVVARVWDGAARLRFVGGNTVTVETTGQSQAEASIDGADLVLTAGNLELRFAGLSGGSPARFVLPGDAWLVEVREFASPVPVPPSTDPDPRLSFRSEPVGIEHDYVFLGLFVNGAFRFDDTTDVRDRAFPPLTDIGADEVSFDPSRVGGTAATVQEAIEDLYLNVATGCGEIAIPENVGLAEFVERLRQQGVLTQGAHLKICLGNRSFDLSTRIVFDNLGHITVTGIGAGSRINATGPAAALAFRNCAAVTLRDFSFDIAHNGANAIDCERCREVEIGHLVVRDRGEGLDVPHGAVAVRVWPGDGQRTPAIRTTVAHCRIEVRAGGNGILVVDGGNTILSANHVITVARTFRLDDWIGVRDFAAALGDFFIDGLAFPDAGFEGFQYRLGAPVDTRTTRRGQFRLGAGIMGALPVTFTSDVLLGSEFWQRLIRANPPNAPRRQDTQAYVRRLKRQLAETLVRDVGLSLSAQDLQLLRGPVQAYILRTTPFVPGGSGLRVAFTQPPRVDRGSGLSASALTELGGQSVQATGNHVDGFLRPIHIGASNSGGSSGDPQADPAAHFVCRSVIVRDNVVGIVPAPTSRQRHGIFVGNTMSATVTGNRVENRAFLGLRQGNLPTHNDLDLSNVPDCDGIRLWGRYGLLVDVTANLIYGTRVGVQFRTVAPQAQSLGGAMTRLEPNAFWGPGPALRSGPA